MSVLVRSAVVLLGVSVALTACSASHASHSANANRYLAIANPANTVLDTSFDALEDNDRDLPASRAVLQTIASTERGFDRSLLALKLPAPMAAVATELVRVNEIRADLTAQAMAATSVASLQRDEVDVEAMNVPVEVQVGILRKDLGLPPPDTD